MNRFVPLGISLVLIASIVIPAFFPSLRPEARSAIMLDALLIILIIDKIIYNKSKEKKDDE